MDSCVYRINVVNILQQQHVIRVDHFCNWLRVVNRFHHFMSKSQWITIRTHLQVFYRITSVMETTCSTSQTSVKSVFWCYYSSWHGSLYYLDFQTAFDCIALYRLKVIESILNGCSWTLSLHTWINFSSLGKKVSACLVNVKGGWMITSMVRFIL